MEIQVKEEDEFNSFIIKEEPSIDESDYQTDIGSAFVKQEILDDFIKTETPEEFIKSEEPNEFVRFEITEINQDPVPMVTIQHSNTKRSRASDDLVYYCAHCPEMFLKKWSLETHIFTHMKVLILKCSKCRMTFKKPKQLREHMAKCFNEPIIYKYPISLLRPPGPKRSVTPKVPKVKPKSRLMCPVVGPVYQILHLECTICRESFKTKKQMKAHNKLTHSSKCPYCEAIFARHKSAEAHILKDHRGLPLDPTQIPPACTICNKVCDDFDALKKHVMVHSIEKSYQCEICKNKYISGTGIRDHFLSEHKGLDLPPGFPDAWIVYTCSRTGKTFSAIQHVLNNFKKSTFKDGPNLQFKCPDCKQKFLNQNLLDQHTTCSMRCKKVERVVKKEIFQCRFCGVIHPSKISVENHEKQHTLDERVNSLFLLLKKAKTATTISKSGEHSRTTSTAVDSVGKIKSKK